MHNIQRMFTSATLKLTAWYLLGIMLLSLGFSILVYQLAQGEIAARLSVIESRIQGDGWRIPDTFDFSTVQQRQLDEARHNIIAVLLHVNIIILAIGGVASHTWARRTLKPIEEAHEAQSRFTSDASHELRTPLAIMQTEIEGVLRDKTATKANYRETLASNLEEVERLSTLSNLLLTMARLETDSLTWQPVNLAATAKRARQTFIATDQRRITITHDKKPQACRANQESILELCVILFENALQHSPADTPIDVQIHREMGKSYIRISNEGSGIQPDDIDKIFQRFYRTDTARTRSKTAHYGLGLSLAKKIVELHHGSITVTSQPGSITTFTVKLP